MAARRQSSVFTVGALSCTTSIFLATVSGIFLCLPFVELSDSSQLTAFGILHAFTVFLLRTTAASLPFGLAALCAKYSSRNDWRTVKHLRLFTVVTVMITAVILAALLAFCAPRLAVYILGRNAAGMTALTNVFYVLAAMILLVSVLYLFRGFYQGLDEMKVDSRSQLIEQTAHILLAGGTLLYIWFHRDHADILLYLMITAMILSLLITIGYYVLFDRLKYPRIEAYAKAQLMLPVKKKKAIGELFAFTLPGFSVAVLQGFFLLINTVFFLPMCRGTGMENSEALKLFDLMQVNCAWLAEIPVLLAYRFSSGMIPDIAEGVEKNNEMLIDRGVEKMFGRFLYAAVPLIFSVCMLAPQLFYILYGRTAGTEGAMVLSWAMAEGLAIALAMISSWLMITLRFNQNSLFYTIVGLIIKALTFYFLIRHMGYAGAMASTCLGVFTILFLCLSRITNFYGVSYQRLFLQLAKIMAACLSMNGVYAIFKYFGLNGLHASRLLSAAHILAMAAVAVPVYLFVTGMLAVRSQLFGRRRRKDDAA